MPPSNTPSKDEFSKSLSVVSEKYDTENKGFLTKEQQKLRNLDVKGTGYLTAEQLAPLLEEYKKIHHENVKNRRLIIALFFAVVLLGTGTIISSLLAVNASKDTSLTSDGVLTAKDTDLPVVTTSQGASAATREVFDHNTGEYIQCIDLEEAAGLYMSFSKGMNVMLHMNNTLSTDNDITASKYSFPAVKVTGDSGEFGGTSIRIGNITFDASPENPCNREDMEGHSRRLFGSNHPACDAFNCGSFWYPHGLRPGFRKLLKKDPLRLYKRCCGVSCHVGPSKLRSRERSHKITNSKS